MKDVDGLKCVCVRATGVIEDVEDMPYGENGKKHKVLGLASRVSGRADLDDEVPKWGQKVHNKYGKKEL